MSEKLVIIATSSVRIVPRMHYWFQVQGSKIVF